MIIRTKPIRKDGKIPVSFGFSNGVWIRKLWTPEQLQAELHRQELEKAEQQPQPAQLSVGPL